MSADADDYLRSVSEPAPPPPSSALLAAMQNMQPVRTRVPARAFTLALFCSLASAGAAFTLFHWRGDLAHLPRIQLLVVQGLWAVGFVLPYAGALLPRRRQVVPDAARAWTWALLVAAVLLIVQFGFAPDAPNETRTVEGQLHQWLECVGIAFGLMVVPFISAFVALRGVLSVGAWRLGGAVGAAGGALGGFVLGLICPYGGAVHTGLAHGGAVLICALAGAVGLGLLLRRG